MTQNQINYWKYREDMRHNVATEVESARHNAAMEGASYEQASAAMAQAAAAGKNAATNQYLATLKDEEVALRQLQFSLDEKIGQKTVEINEMKAQSEMYLNEMRALDYYSAAQLKEAQATTERARQFNLYATGAKSAASTVTEVGGWISSLGKKLFGSSGGSLAQYYGAFG